MVLKSGQVLPADVVIIGAGIIPATAWVKPEFPLQADGGILVDKYMRVAECDNIFAAGDIATFPYHGKSLRIEHWAVAEQHGLLIRNLW